MGLRRITISLCRHTIAYSHRINTSSSRNNFIRKETTVRMTVKRYSHTWKIQCILRPICILLIVAGTCSATLDLSNLNLRDFQFFRYQQTLPNGELKIVKPPPPSFGNHIQRAKSVGTFIQRLLFGYTGNDSNDIPLVFPPTVEHLRERFERRHGYRGKYLIEQLGNGYFRYSSGYTPCSSCKF